jgi:hypothetical protein
MTTTKIVTRPDLGRPTDKRVTQDYLTAHNLPGNPFVPGTDVDVVDQINDALATLAALVSYADPTLGPALATALVNANAATAAVPGTVAAALVPVTQALADNAQLRNLVAQLAGSLLLPTASAFPAASGYSGRSAVALDTGAMYTSNGTTWGAPLGYVVNAAQAAALSTRLGIVEAGQVSAGIAYDTQTNLYTNLAPVAGAVGYVTNDSTPTKNGIYRKVGVTGTGSWVQGVDRTTGVENRTTTLEAVTTRVGTVQNVRNLSNTGTSGTYPVGTAGSVYWCGWAGVAGPRQNFNRLRFWIKPFDPAKPVVSLLVNIRSLTQAGAILATKTVNVTTTTNVATMVEVLLDALVPNASATSLYIEVSSPEKGYFTMLSTTASATARYLNNGPINPAVWTDGVSGNYIPYIEFEEYNATGFALSYTAEMTALLRATLPEGAAAKTTVDRLALLSPTITQAGTTGATVLYGGGNGGANNWTAWTGPIPAFQNFSRLEIQGQPYAGGAALTAMRLRLITNDANLTVLADLTQNVTTTAGVPFTVAFDLPATIVNAAAGSFVMEVYGNGRWVPMQSNYTSVNSPAPRYGVTGSLTDTTTIAAGGFYLYARALLVNTALTLLSLTSDMQAALNALGIGSGNSALTQLSTLGRSMPILTGTTESVPLANAAVYFVPNTTWYGWGSGVGTPQNFNAVQFYLYPANAAALPTNLRVRVRQTDYQGTVLADVTLSLALLNLKANALNLINVPLGTTIANSAAGNLWFEFFADSQVSPVGQQASAPYFNASGSLRYGGAGSISTGTTSVGGPYTAIYALFGMQSASSRFLLDSAVITQIPTPNLNAIFTGTIALPAIIPAVVGSECNIYFNNVIKSWHPLSAFKIRVTTTKGKTENHRWTFTPVAGDIGDTALQVEIWWNGTMVASQAVTVRVKAVNSASAITQKFFSIADSTTEVGRWLGEIETNISAGSNVKYVMVGTRTTTNAPNGPTAKTEARQGWDTNRFFTDATSPFVFGGVFNFGTYLSNNPTITLTAGDWTYINLGINDLMFTGDDAATNAKIDAMFTQIDAMIASIKAAVSGIRIALDVPIPPSNEVGASFGIYGPQVQFARYTRSRHTLAERMYAKYGGQTGSNIYVFDGGMGMDVEDIATFPTTTKTASARSTTSITARTDAIHPNILGPGYLQKADTVYASLRVLEA